MVTVSLSQAAPAGGSEYNTKEFAQVDHFPLYSTYSTFDIDQKCTWPPKNTHLTDLWVGTLVHNGVPQRSLAERYPADFDFIGKIRLIRPPHGEAMKVFIPDDNKDLRKKGVLHYALVNATNLMIEDEGVALRVA